MENPAQFWVEINILDPYEDGNVIDDWIAQT